jgi:hypothetical protein
MENPLWNTWQKTYPLEMERHTLIDIWPFIQSIAEVYPPKSGYDLDMYKESVKRFFKFLFEVLKEMKGYSNELLLLKQDFNQEKIEINMKSKTGFQDLITTTGRKIHAKPTKHLTCDDTCSI